ncbi:hypothetical protein ACOZ4F_00520 (plasmid) [Haloarcula marismortui]|uniref:hypothetical protein n=1 Tax=Haloarcula marismortui TaxID=2238 RepID=UPI003C78E4F4
MGGDQNSSNTVAQSAWTSDDQEVARLVEDFISSDVIPPEIADKVEELHDSGHSHQALKILLQSLDSVRTSI